jgi:hypothetical protein
MCIPDSHGTSVLSTMGGYTETKLVGTAPDAYLLLLKMLEARTQWRKRRQLKKQIV